MVNHPHLARKPSITPEDFAAGCRQALGKADTPAAKPEWSFDNNKPYDGLAIMAKETIAKLMTKRNLSIAQARELVSAHAEIAEYKDKVRRHENARTLSKLIPEFSEWLVQYVAHHFRPHDDGLIAAMECENEWRKGKGWSSSSLLDDRLIEIKRAMESMTPERRAEVEAMVRFYRLGAL